MVSFGFIEILLNREYETETMLYLVCPIVE